MHLFELFDSTHPIAISNDNRQHPMQPTGHTPNTKSNHPLFFNFYVRYHR